MFWKFYGQSQRQSVSFHVAVPSQSKVQPTIIVLRLTRIKKHPQESSPCSKETKLVTNQRLKSLSDPIYTMSSLRQWLCYLYFLLSCIKRFVFRNMRQTHAQIERHVFQFCVCQLIFRTDIYYFWISFGVTAQLHKCLKP